MAAGGQVTWEAWAARYARLAVAAAFLSAVAGRFGLWSGHFNWDLTRFINRTAELNPFMPPATIPFLAWAATIAETSLALALVTGIDHVYTSHRWPRRGALFPLPMPAM